MAIHDFDAGDGTPDYCAMLQMITSQACIEWNHQPKMAQCIAECGGGELRGWTFLIDGLPSSWCSWKVGNDIVINITGTASSSVWMRNMGGVVSTAYDGGGCQAHRYVQQFWNTLKPAIMASLPADIPAFRYKLTGHSMGDMVSYHAALDFARTFGAERVQYMGFGGGKSLSNNYTGARPDTEFLVAGTNDVVPYLPSNGITSFLDSNIPGIAWAIPTDWIHYTDNFLINDFGDLSSRDAAWFQQLPSKQQFSSWDTEHLIQNYQRRIEQGWTRRTNGLCSPGLILISQFLRNSPVVQNLNVNLNPGAFIDVADVNGNLFNQPNNGPVNNGNLGQIQNAVGQINQVQVANGNNIGHTGKNMTALSNYYKITLHLNTPREGRAFSVILSLGSNSTFDQANVRANTLAQNYAKCMGNKNAGDAKNFSGDGIPCIEWITVADAFNNKNSRLFGPFYNQASYMGPNTVQNQACDVFSNTVMKQMYGTSDQDANIQSHRPIAISGIPDDVSKGENFVFGTLVAPGVLWETNFDALLAYLKNAGTAWGFLGIGKNAPYLSATNATWDATNSRWIITVDTTGWHTGDRITLVKADKPGWSGSYKIVVINPTSIALVNLKQGDLIGFTEAKISRYKGYDGKKYLDFFKFDTVSGGFPTCRSHDPGRPFDPTASRRRRHK